MVAGRTVKCICLIATYFTINNSPLINSLKDFITELFCIVDDALRKKEMHPEAKAIFVEFDEGTKKMDIVEKIV